jgi:hypothetical protein
MSVISDIETVIQLRLQAILEENGYAEDVAQVILPKRHNDWQPRHRTLLVSSSDPVRSEDSDRPGNPPAIAYSLPVEVSGFVIPSKDDNRSSNELVTNLMSDAIKAIASVQDWHQFGGNSINADLGPINFVDPDDESPAGGKFQVDIIYRISETDPYQVRA